MNDRPRSSVPPFALVIVKLGDWMERILALIGGVAVVAFVTAVFLDVVAREVFRPISWGQEIALFSYVWAIFMGSAIGIRHGTHFTIDLLVEQTKGRLHKGLEIFDHVVVLIFVSVMAVYGWKYAVICLNRFSQPSGICMTWGTACMVVGAICMVYYSVEYFVLLLMGTNLRQCKAHGKEDMK